MNQENIIQSAPFPAGTVFLASLGCPRNRVDSEMILGALSGAGFAVAADPADADIIVVNTCGFVQDAVNESIDVILELARFRTEGSCRKLIVCGCLVQRYGEELATALPEADLFLGTSELSEVLAAAKGAYPRADTGPALCLSAQTAIPPLPGPDDGRLRTTPHMAYLKIAEGCPEHCTFCVIPKLRGKLRSKPREDILAEARLLAASGCREIVLVAQETTAWGMDLPGRPGFSALLSATAEALPDVWIRFLYGHPARVSDELLSIMASHPNICPYLDIPVQHASAPVLKRMGRHYNEKELVKLFSRIRKKLPGCALRTTLLTGFPGETASDVAKLRAFMEEVRFDHLGVFAYSDGPDLASHALPDHVPKREAKARAKALMTLQAAISREKNKQHAGQTVPVLITGTSDKKTFPWAGRTMLQAPEIDGLTFVAAQDTAPGEIVEVTIIRSSTFDLFARKEKIEKE
ncbi:MAG: 30S ribosomal protein S12 methylthiotransferase RimO [Thermodesulfobacteriota bacterium]